MDEQLTLEEILREGMIGNPNHQQLHSDDLQRAAERGDTEGKTRGNRKSKNIYLGNDWSEGIQKVKQEEMKRVNI